MYARMREAGFPRGCGGSDQRAGIGGVVGGEDEAVRG